MKRTIAFMGTFAIAFAVAVPTSATATTTGTVKNDLLAVANLTSDAVVLYVSHTKTTQMYSGGWGYENDGWCNPERGGIAQSAAITTTDITPTGKRPERVTYAGPIYSQKNEAYINLGEYAAQNYVTDANITQARKILQRENLTFSKITTVFWADYVERLGYQRNTSGSFMRNMNCTSAPSIPLNILMSMVGRGGKVTETSLPSGAKRYTVKEGGDSATATTTVTRNYLASVDTSSLTSSAR